MILALLVILLVLILPMVGYRDACAFYTAGALTGAIAVIPYRYLRRYLLGRLTRFLPSSPLPMSRLSFGRARRLAMTCALLGLVGLAVLARTDQLGLLIPSLPGVSVACAWLLIMDAFACWVTVARPLPASTAPQETTTVDGES